MAPPAMDHPFPSSKLPLDTPSSRSSDDDRDNTDGAVDEFPSSAGAAPTPTKRPRGRPAGSKNKPKTPTYVSVDPQDSLRSHVMEISSGADIPSSLSAYARSHGRGVSVLHAIGSVAGATFRHPPNTNSNSPLFLKGKLHVISLSGTVLPDNASVGPAGLTVFVSGPHGQVLGGPVEGRLVAEGPVVVMAATFSTATYEKLPLQEPGSAGPVGPGQDGLGPDPGYHGAPGFNVGQESNSYAWFLHQQQQHSSNNINDGRPVYLNN